MKQKFIFSKSSPIKPQANIRSLIDYLFICYRYYVRAVKDIL